MAISKRLRFEILRRDNHTCRYCGRKPPEVELTIDHVQPIALGGRDVAENLVTCCKDCNSGKTSTVPDGPLVAQVAEDEVRWSAAMHVGIAKIMASHQAGMDYRDQFVAEWDSWKTTDGDQPIPKDSEWRNSVENFRSRGLPIEILVWAVKRAMDAAHIDHATKFKYTCGIAWNKIGEIDAEARLAFEQSQSAPTETPAISEQHMFLLRHLLVVWGWAWDRHPFRADRTDQLVDEFVDATYALLHNGASAEHDLTDAAFRAGDAGVTDMAPYLDGAPH